MSLILVFGASLEGSKHIEKLESRYTVLGFIDNDKEKHGKEWCGYGVYSVDEGLNLPYDRIYITSMYAGQMKEQLLLKGVSSDRIIVADKINDFFPLTKNTPLYFAAHYYLARIIELSAQNKLNLWADFGTLLGFAREGDFIEHDSDIDLSVDATDASKLLNSLRGHEDLFSKKVISYENFTLHFDANDILSDSALVGIHMYISSENTSLQPLPIEIKSYQDKDGGLVSAAHPGWMLPVPNDFIFPIESLRCNAGYDVPVPKEITKRLEQLYGKKWYHPDKQFKFSDYSNLI